MSLKGEGIAAQSVRWGLLTAEASAVETGAATTDAQGRFTIKAKRELAVVVVVEHDEWSAWVELPGRPKPPPKKDAKSEKKDQPSSAGGAGTTGG